MVIGSGPNGLAAGVVLARAGYPVEVHESSSRIGGAASSGPLTLPGYIHDFGSAVHPLAVASPFFNSLPLGIDWIHPTAPLAHPLDDGTAVILWRDLSRTAEDLGPEGKRWREVFEPIVSDWEILRHELLGPIGWTRHPLSMARFGLQAIHSAAAFIPSAFQGARTRALFAGLAAHYPFFDQPLSAGFGLVLGAAAHAGGWPIPRGGAQTIANALGHLVERNGGRILTNSPVESLADVKGLVMADVSPHRLAEIAGTRLPVDFRAKLKQYRYGPGAFKVDYALSRPIPWRAPGCALAGTVHLGGTWEEIAASERAASQGKIAEQPFILLSQPTLFDATRAPAGKHIAWAYCHVPHGSHIDMTSRMEAQIERFAPGFHDIILGRHVVDPPALEQWNPNLVGGDVTGGVADLSQTLFRPTRSGYRTPDPRIFICSSATSPGAGVHGMCGYHAAQSALRHYRR